MRVSAVVEWRDESENKGFNLGAERPLPSALGTEMKENGPSNHPSRFLLSSPPFKKLNLKRWQEKVISYPLSNWGV